MALINCPECKREISDKATACPHCGCPAQNSALAASAVGRHDDKTGVQGTSATQSEARWDQPVSKVPFRLPEDFDRRFTWPVLGAKTLGCLIVGLAGSALSLLCLLSSAPDAVEVAKAFVCLSLFGSAGLFLRCTCFSDSILRMIIPGTQTAVLLGAAAGGAIAFLGVQNQWGLPVLLTGSFVGMLGIYAATIGGGAAAFRWNLRRAVLDGNADVLMSIALRFAYSEIKIVRLAPFVLPKTLSGSVTIKGSDPVRNALWLDAAMFRSPQNATVYYEQARVLFCRPETSVGRFCSEEHPCVSGRGAYSEPAASRVELMPAGLPFICGAHF